MIHSMNLRIVNRNSQVSRDPVYVFFKIDLHKLIHVTMETYLNIFNQINSKESEETFHFRLKIFLFYIPFHSRLLF